MNRRDLLKFLSFFVAVSGDVQVTPKPPTDRSGSLTGSLNIPDPDDVRVGVSYGSGVEWVGTIDAGQVADLDADTVAAMGRRE